MPVRQFFSRLRRDDAGAELPPELVAAIDAGNVEEVTKLLAAAPETMSKAQKKKAQKNAEINAKKIAKGGVAAVTTKMAAASTASPPPVAASSATAPAAAAKKPAAAAAPVPTGAGMGVVAGAAELELVEAMLACAGTLALPADALAQLRDNAGTLALSIAPLVNAQRNDAYAMGFGAHGSR